MRDPRELRSLLETLYPPPRRKVFVSHSHLHALETQRFLREFTDVAIFKHRGVGFRDDLINSRDPEYVMSRIRAENIGDSTVTIVLVGSCTHSRRYIDWEIKASLRQGEDSLPNGLLAIALPSTGGTAQLPERLMANWQRNGSGYADYLRYPSSGEELRRWIEVAFARRESHSHLISNAPDRWYYNAKCDVCGFTHGAT